MAYSEDSDPFSMRTTLVRDGGYQVTGHKIFIAGGLRADLFLVAGHIAQIGVAVAASWVP